MYQNYGESLKFLELLFSHLSLAERQAVNLTLTEMRPDKTPHDGQGSLTATSRHISPANPAAIGRALDRAQLLNGAGSGVFASIAFVRPGLSKYKRGARDDLRLVPALWCDLDGQPATRSLLDRLHRLLPPTLVVASSHTGSHVYWLLNEPTPDVARIDALLLSIADRLNGCKFAATQPMRLPGTQNTKPERDSACHFVNLNRRRNYDLEQIEQVFPPARRHQRAPAPTKRPAAAQSQEKRKGYDPLKPELLAEVERTIVARYDGRYKQNGWIAARCPFEHGRDRPGSHFNYHPTMGVGYCFGEHKRIMLRDLCGVLGIDLTRYDDSIYDKPVTSTRANAETS